MISLEQAATKLASGIGNAGPAYEMGVDSITVHPGELAAANVEGYVQGVLSGQQKWARNVKRMPLAELKNRMKTEGKSRLTSSGTKARAGWTRAMQTWYPIIQQVQAQVKAMPNKSRGDRTARMQRYHELMNAAADQQLTS